MFEKGHLPYFIFDFIVPIIGGVFFTFLSYVFGIEIENKNEEGTFIWLMTLSVCFVIVCFFYFIWSFHNWKIINNKLTCIR